MSGIIKGLIIILTVLKCVKSDLYNASDSMTILTANNFRENVINSESAWIIEYYFAWCGHCIKFVPTWRTFADEVKDWRHTVQVGALDCSDEDNVAVCRDYEVHGYPTIRLFGAFTKKGDIGEATPNRTSDALQEVLINFLVKSQDVGTPSRTWVNLRDYEDSVEQVFDDVSRTVTVAILIKEAANSTVGRHTILELGNYKTISVRRVVSTTKRGEETLPSMFLKWRNGEFTTINEGVETWQQQVDTIKRIALLQDPDEYSTTTNAYVASSTSSREEVTKSSGRPIDKVYLVDLETTVSYALSHEVIIRKTLSGESLEALRKFVHVLVKYLPSRPPVHRFLKKFHAYISKQNSIEGETLSKVIGEFSSGTSVLPEVQPWVGCKGSDPKYRGYPCGLWTTFHTLTVNAVLADGKKRSYDPQEVLEATHGYVKHFFSCKHCSQHFQAMYAVDAKEYVTSANDGITWLWQAHNQVNTRLKGDLTEDPKHIKILFPCPKKCPECWDKNKQFNRVPVLRYLKKIYSRDSLYLTDLQKIDNTKESETPRVIVEGGQTSEALHSRENQGIMGIPNKILLVCFLVTSFALL